MNDVSRQAHWEHVYGSKAENEVSWFQQSPAPSLELIELCRPASDAAIVDIGGGASRLVDRLLERGFSDLTVLDLSHAALAADKARLGDRAVRVQWVAADFTRWVPARLFDIWHDRAAFHFLTDAADRAAYVACLNKAIRPGGSVIIGTFAPDGPEKCSGCLSIAPMLPVSVRCSAASFGWCIRGGMSTPRHGLRFSAFNFPYSGEQLSLADFRGVCHR